MRMNQPVIQRKNPGMGEDEFICSIPDRSGVTIYADTVFFSVASYTEGNRPVSPAILSVIRYALHGQYLVLGHSELGRELTQPKATETEGGVAMPGRKQHRRTWKAFAQEDHICTGKATCTPDEPEHTWPVYC